MNIAIIDQLLNLYNDSQTQNETHSDRYNEYNEHSDYSDAHSPTNDW